MTKLYLCLLAALSLSITACASGATVGVGGGGGSYGGGGGVSISFPVDGDSSSGQSSANDPMQTEEQAQASIQNQNGGDPSGNYIGSNLSNSYPKHDCYQPMKPDSGDSSGLHMIYKQKLDSYRLCIDTYARNAKNDMMDIEAKANSALREYRLFVTRP